MIKVSVIIPAYNSANLIGQTILSVLKQTWQQWEMIVINDGSTDNTGEVIDAFTKQDDRISLYHQTNAGASDARNAGIKKAKFDWLLFLDADDWIRDDYFEKMIPVLEEDSSIDVVHCGWTRVLKDGTLIKENFGGEHHNMFYSLSYYCPFAIHSCIVRKKIVEQAGGFDTSFKTCGDWDLWQRVARTGANFHLVKQTMAFYRTRSNSLSSDANQVCKNGLQVISNAYSLDLRVTDPKPEYANGIDADDLVNRKYYFVAWSAGLLIGGGKSSSHLLEYLKDTKAENLNSDLVSESLLDSIIVPAEKEQCNWLSHWQGIKDPLKKFLDDFEEQSHSKNIGRLTCAFIERHVIMQSSENIKQLQVGKSFAERIDVEEIVTDKCLPGDIDKFFGIVQLNKKTLGIIELPVADGFLPAAIIKDAIATKFSWQILQYFFSGTIYSSLRAEELLTEEELHDKIGWKIFLQQLWQRPQWSESMFYDPAAEKKEKATPVQVKDEVHLEISEEFPAIKAKASELKIIYYAGGIRVGTTLCKVEKRIASPQVLRAAINLHSGYELCRVVVREALIGQKLNVDETLLQRLKQAKKKFGFYLK